ncbi:MAG TPA: hypothetical protein VMD27_13095 [Candidatus Aquilonibacter sp.]|nr:hypothetical protein [Candidatus Aquilonibacter sp.]
MNLEEANAKNKFCKFAYEYPMKGLILIFLLTVAFSLPADAQSYSIDWYKISGGGGTSTNSQYAVTGTIGQHDASIAMTGGNYSLTGGFWALISVAQTPVAPPLYISHSGNTVKIYWQDVAGWSLEQNNSLTMPANWTASVGVTTSDGTNSLTLTNPTGNLFFRLTQ